MYTVSELEEVRAYVQDRLQNRTFAEHPEDRIELMHKAQVLDRIMNTSTINDYTCVDGSWVISNFS